MCIRDRDRVVELVVVNKADRAPMEAKALAHSIDGSVLLSALSLIHI